MIFAFYFLSTMTLLSALAVVRSRNIVHAGYWLLPCFVGIAGLFAALEAHFFFVVQLLVYAGAILVLILFAVMITRNAGHPDRRRANSLVIPAALTSLATAGVTCWILSAHFAVARGPRGLFKASDFEAAGPAEQTKQLGEALIGPYALPFEIASLILVAALIGAVIVAKSDSKPERPEHAVVTAPVETPEKVEA